MTPFIQLFQISIFRDLYLCTFVLKNLTSERHSGKVETMQVWSLLTEMTQWSLYLPSILQKALSLYAKLPLYILCLPNNKNGCHISQFFNGFEVFIETKTLDSTWSTCVIYSDVWLNNDILFFKVNCYYLMLANNAFH